MRFKLLLRGLLFYNTIYWERASDGLNPPKLTAAQRKMLAPPKDLEVIKPREKPRARIDEATRRQRRADLESVRRLPPTLASKIPPSRLALADLRAKTPPAAPRPKAPGVVVRGAPVGVSTGKRRRKRRAHRVPTQDLPPTSLVGRFLAKWLRT